MFARMRNVRVRAMGPTIAGLLTVPLLPFMLDHPVEYAVSTVFDRIELAFQRVRGEDTLSSACKRYNQMTSVKVGYKTREVDRISGSEASDAPASTLAENMGKAAVLGVGIDMVFIPRIGQLIARHAKRVARNATPVLAATPRYANGENEHSKLVSTQLEMQAARRFASRILSPSEASVFSRLPAARLCHNHVHYLASR